MPKNFDNQFRSRSGQRAKRRKTNLILNSLIIIVILLIMIVASKIFLGGGKDDKKESATGNQLEQKASNKNEQNDNKSGASENNKQASDKEASNDNSNDENINDNNDQSIDEESNEDLESEETIAEESTEPNVKKSFTNPNWKSVGTEQVNGHQYSADQNSVDWKEKEEALSYATGISPDNLTIWYLGRGGSDSEAIGTVTPKDQSKVYRVYLNWIDGQGWKPTKVDELKENDKK